MEETKPEVMSTSVTSTTSSSGGNQRISPLRGGLTHEEIVTQTRGVRNGLCSLRDDHYSILRSIRNEYENKRNGNNSAAEETESASPKNDNDHVLMERINNVTKSLEDLEVGIEESQVILGLSDHFQRMEADHVGLRLEMSRVVDENDWLREELSETQRKLQEALLELTDLQEEKKKRDFEEEMRNITESNARPITPSKIPVGSWRVEEEKDINRALNGGDRKLSSTANSSRSASPAPSRIPLGGWRNKLSVYKKVMDKDAEKEKARKTLSNGSSGLSKKGNYFKLNASRSKIPSR